MPLAVFETFWTRIDHCHWVKCPSVPLWADVGGVVVMLGVEWWWWWGSVWRKRADSDLRDLAGALWGPACQQGPGCSMCNAWKIQ